MFVKEILQQMNRTKKARCNLAKVLQVPSNLLTVVSDLSALRHRRMQRERQEIRSLMKVLRGLRNL